MQKAWYVHVLSCLPLKSALMVTVLMAITVLLTLHLIILPMERMRSSTRLTTMKNDKIPSVLYQPDELPSSLVNSHAAVSSWKLSVFSNRTEFKESHGSVPSISRGQHRLISAQVIGRLGNCLFTYASLLGIAKWSSRIATLPSTHHMRVEFSGISASVSPPAHYTPAWVMFTENQSCAFDERTLRIDDEAVVRGVSAADMVQLVGYYQSWQYFEHIKDEIRAQFKLNSDHMSVAQSVIRKVIMSTFGADTKRSDVTLIGIHVRRGDMTSHDSYRLGYTTATAGYIHRAIKHFILLLTKRKNGRVNSSQKQNISSKSMLNDSSLNQHKIFANDLTADYAELDNVYTVLGRVDMNQSINSLKYKHNSTKHDSIRLFDTTVHEVTVKVNTHRSNSQDNMQQLLFILSTDDRPWCAENVNFSDNVIMLPVNKDIVDLAILSTCDHMIITVGTFGWWAAWLAGGKTIYYQDFPRPKSYLASQFKASEYFYPGWIGMS